MPQKYQFSIGNSKKIKLAIKNQAFLFQFLSVGEGFAYFRADGEVVFVYGVVDDGIEKRHIDFAFGC